MQKNHVRIIGEIVSGFTFNHEVLGESFYILNVSVRRLSEQVDIIPLMVSARLLNVDKDYMGCTIEVFGQYRSYNHSGGTKNRLGLSVFVQELSFIDEFADYTKTNHIFLDGYICKVPTYRKTPMGREVTDVLLAVNRTYNKTDYIPCILWGRNARYASSLNVGSNILIRGRVQSREYTKKLNETDCEKRIAYEVSVSELDVRETEVDNGK